MAPIEGKLYGDSLNERELSGWVMKEKLEGVLGEFILPLDRRWFVVRGGYFFLFDYYLVFFSFLDYFTIFSDLIMIFPFLKGFLTYYRSESDIMNNNPAVVMNLGLSIFLFIFPFLNCSFSLLC